MNLIHQAINYSQFQSLVYSVPYFTESSIIHHICKQY